MKRTETMYGIVEKSTGDIVGGYLSRTPATAEFFARRDFVWDKVCIVELVLSYDDGKPAKPRKAAGRKGVKRDNRSH